MTFVIFNRLIVQNFLLIIYLFISFHVWGSIILLNSSCDTGRELFVAINESFVRYWSKNHPDDHVMIRQSHAASTRQAIAVLQGLPADVVTYNQVTDVQILYDRGKLISDDWKSRFPNNSSPFYSTIAFVVRKGNPKQVYDWYDLVSENIQIILPNPKISGNGRYIYLAVWEAISQVTDNRSNIYSWMAKFFHNVLVFDIGSRSAASTFIDRKQGDVLITFESEANVICRQYGVENYEIIVPRKNVLAEFPVTWIDGNIHKNGTGRIAKEYLQYLYTENAQRIIANFFYRVNLIEVMKEYSKQFPDIQLFRVEDRFGDWNELMYIHFSSGGELDKILAMRYNN